MKTIMTTMQQMIINPPNQFQNNFQGGRGRGRGGRGRGRGWKERGRVRYSYNNNPGNYKQDNQN